MKLTVKNFERFNETLDPIYVMGDVVNEGFFDKLMSFFTKVINLFRDPVKLDKGIDVTITESGDKSKILLPKNYKTKETVMVSLGDPAHPDQNFSIAFTKLANMPDGSGLFQIVGTTSVEMLKALTRSEKIEMLAQNNVMALIPQTGFVTGKPLTMRLIKNMFAGGKDYVTKASFIGAVPGLEVEQTLTKIK